MRSKVDVRDFVSLEYMGLSEKEMTDLDKRVEKTIKSSTKELKEAPWQRNTHYQDQDVVETLGDPDDSKSKEEEKGGEN